MPEIRSKFSASLVERWIRRPGFGTQSTREKLIIELGYFQHSADLSASLTKFQRISVQYYIKFCAEIFENSLLVSAYVQHRIDRKFADLGVNVIYRNINYECKSSKLSTSFKKQVCFQMN